MCSFAGIVEPRAGKITVLADRLGQIQRENESVAKLVRSLEDLPPSPGPYARALQACGKSRALVEGKRVHQLIIQVGLQHNLILSNHTVRMYACCGSIPDAHHKFSQMQERNSVSWNAIISAYAIRGHFLDCFLLFWQMLQDGAEVSRITFLLLLGVCNELVAGRGLHALLRESGVESDVVVATALLTMYSNCGSPDDAREVFDRMDSPNTVSWTSMLTALAKSGQSVQAVRFFSLMLQQGERGDVVTFITVLTACKEISHVTLCHAWAAEAGFLRETNICNALINTYGSCGDLKVASKLFHQMQHRNVVSWTVMISAHSLNGQDKQALLLFLEMLQEGVKPDQVTLFQMLDVCGDTNSIAEGRMVVACSVEIGVDLRGVFGNAVVSMFGRCGSLNDAKRVFKQLKKQDRVSWTAMITAYSQHGRSGQALEMFQRMKQAGVDPDSVTYVSVLSVCNHAGRLSEGCRMFYSMVSDDGLVPEVEHCGCVVGLLRRAGWVREAEEFVRRMSSWCDSNSGIWNSLLAAAGLHGDVESGKRAAERLLELDSQEASAYVYLSNIAESRAGADF